MKTLIRTALALPLLVVLGSAARPADDKAPEATTPYYPLKVGDTWNYRVGDSKYTCKVAKLEEFNKQTCARIEIVAGGKVTSTEYVAVKPDGVYRYGFEGDKADPPVCFLKLPVKAGDTWKVESKLDSKLYPGKVTGTFKTGEEATLKVGDKTYEKVVTVSTDDLVGGDSQCKATYYYAKDVGMVKLTMKVGANDIVIELESFEPAKP